MFYTEVAMLLPGLTTDLRVAREVYDFRVDEGGRILSDDNLGRPLAVPEVLTRWSHNRLAARQLLDYCAEERGWRWRLERDADLSLATIWVNGRPYSHMAATEALAICGAALAAAAADTRAIHEQAA